MSAEKVSLSHLSAEHYEFRGRGFTFWALPADQRFTLWALSPGQGFTCCTLSAGELHTGLFLQASQGFTTWALSAGEPYESWKVARLGIGLPDIRLKYALSRLRLGQRKQHSFCTESRPVQHL